MSDLPSHVEIHEEGPREGFQIEPGPIPTADKIALIDALSATGVKRIQVASFVNPKLVPGWADAEAVVAGFTPRDGVTYGALWFNPRGLERTLAFRDRLSVAGSITVSASEAFSKQNREGNPPSQKRMSRIALGRPTAGPPRSLTMPGPAT